MTRTNNQKPLIRKHPVIPPPPMQQTQQPQHQPQTPSMMNSIKDSMISGFGFGIGSSIAHKLSDKMFTSTPSTATTPKIDCSQMLRDVEKCFDACDTRDCNSVIVAYANCSKKELQEN